MRIRGLVKALDRQGRIVIPKEMLTALEIEPGTMVEIISGLDPDGMPAIVVRKYHKGCRICAQPVRKDGERRAPDWRRELEGLTIYGDKRICRDCLAEINAQIFQKE